MLHMNYVTHKPPQVSAWGDAGCPWTLLVGEPRRMKAFAITRAVYVAGMIVPLHFCLGISVSEFHLPAVSAAWCDVAVCQTTTTAACMQCPLGRAGCWLWPVVPWQGLSGGTTVSGTMIAAHKAGICVFVTGGIGGVHRGGENSKKVDTFYFSSYCCSFI